MYYCDKIDKLENHNYAKCGYEYYGDGEGIIFYSYDTKVLEICDCFIMCYGLFSQTTRKHISWFLNEFYGDSLTFNDIKKIAGKNVVMNIFTKKILNAKTGEVIECGL